MTFESAPPPEQTKAAAERAIDNELVARFKDAQAAAEAAPDESTATIEANHASMVWGELYARHNGKLRKQLWVKTSGPEELEDIAQETFFRAYRAINQYNEADPASSFGAWLCRMGSNAAIDAFRRRRRINFETLDNPDRPLHVASTFGNPEPEVVQTDYSQILRLIPKVFGETIELVDIKGLSYDEAAAELDIPVGTVRSQLHRGRSYLLRELLDYADKTNNLDDYLASLVRRLRPLSIGHIPDEAAS